MFHPSPNSLVCHHLLEKAPGGQGRATTASAQPAASPLCQVSSMSIYLCICVYVCVYVYAQMCMVMCIYASVHVFIYMFVHTCVYTYHLGMHACMHVYEHLCMCLHMCKELCIGWASQQELPFSIVSQVLPGLYHPKFHAYQAVIF